MLKTIQSKARSKKGFTLMEMLIVVAIIAILVAIAIPVFSAQLNKAQVQVEKANSRSAQSMAFADYLVTGETAATTYYALIDAEHNMTVTETKPAAGTECYTVEIAANGATVKVTGPAKIA